MAELKLAQFARAIIGRPRILLLDSFFKDIDSNIQIYNSNSELLKSFEINKN